MTEVVTGMVAISALWLGVAIAAWPRSKKPERQVAGNWLYVWLRGSTEPVKYLLCDDVTVGVRYDSQNRPVSLEISKTGSAGTLVGLSFEDVVRYESTVIE